MQCNAKRLWYRELVALVMMRRSTNSTLKNRRRDNQSNKKMTAFTINAHIAICPMSRLPSTCSAAFVVGGETLLPAWMFLGDEQTRWLEEKGLVVMRGDVVFEKYVRRVGVTVCDHRS